MTDPDILVDLIDLHVRSASAPLERLRGYCDSVAALDALNDVKVQIMEAQHALRRLRVAAHVWRHRRSELGESLPIVTPQVGPEPV
jgi:hypothetical protein